MGSHSWEVPRGNICREGALGALTMCVRSGVEPGPVFKLASTLQLCYDLLQQIHPGRGWGRGGLRLTLGRRKGPGAFPPAPHFSLLQAGEATSSDQLRAGYLQE